MLGEKKSAPEDSQKMEGAKLEKERKMGAAAHGVDHVQELNL